uniref:Alpha-2-macroglobulin domain-containing protein n=1 Tax=Musca domestica TaxID=7370 RepID=A0A1I8MQ18_MUSDO
MLEALQEDTSRLPFLALVYPGLMSGVLTLTNAHYEFVPLQVDNRKLPDPLGELTFRKNFPETWIFENYEITNDTTQLTLNIPDTVTTWRVTAFTMNEKTGFGIVDGPTDVTTIQPFFISLNLPYSVKRGEIVAIPILIHNYLNRSLDTEITLLNSNNEFYFMESTILNTETGSSEEGRTKNITMPANSVDTVLFYISPRLVGDIKLRITATNSMASDAIIDTLRVQPEGIRQEFNNPQYISVIPSEPIELSYPLSLPANMVPQSEFITLTVVGDDMVPVLLNLNDLLYLPTGCGEQNMANFAPNVLALQYLRSTGQYHREAKLVAKVKRNIEVGYQQQLTYRHNNGGYSVFGQRKDFEASTWLTAYTVRFFIKTLKYAMAIEKHIIETGLHYLATAQRDDGSFPYTGYLLYPAQQNRFGFTAFVLMTFLEDEILQECKGVTTISDFSIMHALEQSTYEGLRFLHNRMDEINDLYALSIIAVTLQMAEENASSKKVLDRLMQHKESDNESVWWSQNDRNMAKDVEITGYVLVAMLKMGYNKEAAEKAYKWLTRQRNKKGGFKSSHDTVVGLQALIQYPVKYKKSSGQINVVVNYKAVDDEKRTVRAGEISVDQSNAKILQTEEVSWGYYIKCIKCQNAKSRIVM